MAKHSLKDGSGYLIIDHTDSPGLRPEDIPARLKTTTPVVGAGQKYEVDIQFCAHCGSQIILNPKRTRPREFCVKCNHYVCDNPICIKECAPLKKLLDKAETSLVRGGEILLTDK